MLIINKINIMKKNILRLTIVLILVSSFIEINSYSQQDVQLTQYSSALQLTNPAYVGTSGRLNATGIIRNQWVGFEGAPKSQVLLINSPFLRYHFGVGLTLIRDEIGPTKNTLLYLNAAYNFNLTRKLKLSMGLSGGFNVNSLDAASFSPGSYNDPAISLEKQVEFLPNFGTGIYLYSTEFYLGLSTPKLVKNDVAAVDQTQVSGGEEQHFFIIGGYLFKIDENWKAKPSFSLKMVKGSPLSFDVTANAIYDDKLWFGLMYRHGDAAGFIFQYQVTDKIRAGYSYDLPLTQMMKNSAGSHEILISFDLIFKDKKIVTPRYF